MMCLLKSHDGYIMMMCLLKIQLEITRWLYHDDVSVEITIKAVLKSVASSRVKGRRFVWDPSMRFSHRLIS